MLSDSSWKRQISNADCSEEGRVLSPAKYCLVLYLQVIQHQTVKYEIIPLSPLSKHRISKYLRLKFGKYVSLLQSRPQGNGFLAADETALLSFSSGMVKRKTLVLDLDETLIHSHHDGVLRQTVKPGTPPDFVLKVSMVSLCQRHHVSFG